MRPLATSNSSTNNDIMPTQNLQIDLGKVAIAPKGNYSATATYERLDLVKANNSGYVSIQDNNTGHSVTDTAWWMCVIDGSEAQAQAAAAQAAAAQALSMANAANTAAGNANTQAAAASAGANAANTAAASATTAATTANDAADRCEDVIAAAAEVEQLGLLPTALTVEYPEEITFGNMTELYVKGILTPDYVLPNLLYFSDNRAVAVAPDGRITVLREGKSVIHVIPTGNTRLYKTIEITVQAPGLRMVNSRTILRKLGNGNLRLN